MRLLEGVRVLDLTNVLAGPFATLHLSLLGAEVIKIENPDGGDLARKLGNVPEYNQQLLGTSFLAQNANKKSLTLNLKAEEGKEIFRRLARRADVLVENFRPGVMERLGFSYEQLLQDQPQDHLLRHHWLWPDRTRRLQAGLRSDHPGPLGPDVDQRRRTLEPAALRLPGLRHGRRAERGLRHHGGAVPPPAHGRGSIHRHRPARLDHAPDGLGGCQPADRRAATGSAGQREFHGRALQHVQDEGWLHQHRRQSAAAMGRSGRRIGLVRAEDGRRAFRNAMCARPIDIC